MADSPTRSSQADKVGSESGVRVWTLTPDSDPVFLERIVRDINAATWDEGDVGDYDVESLKYYLAQQHTVFVVCYAVSGTEQQFLGMSSGRLEIKPYARSRWLYIDEVDVCVEQRQKGAGKAMMRALLAWAAEHGCEEVWLGTETDNVAANALYRSLAPADISADVVGYTWEVGGD